VVTRKKLIYEKPLLFDFRDVQDETVSANCGNGRSDQTTQGCHTGIRARYTCHNGNQNTTATCHTGTVANNTCSNGRNVRGNSCVAGTGPI
jgi:hypothetical protein